MPTNLPPPRTEAEEIVLFVEVRCRACFAPGLIRTAGARPIGAIAAGRLYIRERRYELLSFRCDPCGHEAADLIDVTEAAIRITTPQNDPHPALPRPRLFLCEGMA